MIVGAAAAAVTAGTALGLGRAWLARPASLAVVITFLAAVLLRGRREIALGCVLVGLSAGAMSSASWRSLGASESILPGLAQRRVVVEACGTIRLRRPRSVEIQATQATTPDGLWDIREPLRISGNKVRQLRPGEGVCARGPLAAPRPERDEAPLLVFRELRTTGTGSPVRLAAGEVRRRFAHAARAALPRTQAGLLLGMTDGDVELIDEETMEDFRTTGLAHLVAVSGSNVAVVLAIVMLAVRGIVPRGRLVRAAIAVPALVFFAFLTGLEASVLRAVITAGVALAVTSCGRRAEALRVSAFAFIALVLTSPDLLVHPGFQLSFAATIGLILWAGPLTERLARLLPGPIGNAAAAATATTIAAQVAVAPLLAWHFGRVPAVGGVANLLVAPLAPVVMIGGAVTLGAASVVPALDWLPSLMRLPLDVILWAARWFADLPGASFQTSVVVGIAIAAGLAAVITRGRTRAVVGVVVLVLVPSAFGQALAGRSTQCSDEAVHVLDVGQGTAVLLRSDEASVLVDGGPESGRVVDRLKEMGVKRLDAVFVSHGDADHAQGVLDVLARLDVGRVIGPEALPNGTGKQIVSAARSFGVPVVNAVAGDSFRLDSSLTIDVLWPEAGDVPMTEDDSLNAFSLVLRAQLGEVPIVLPGDIAAEQGRSLKDEHVAASILVAPHHGSKDLDPGFVGAVAPKLTLITVGQDNRYGHPAPEALRAYSRYGNVFRTDQDGEVSVCVGSGGVEVWTQR